MPSDSSLRADAAGLLRKAELNAQIKVRDVISGAARAGALNGDRLAFPILIAIEDEGREFITSMIEPYRAATANGVKPVNAVAILRNALEGYLIKSKEWGRSGQGFRGGRNTLLDRDHGPMAERLKDQLELEVRAVDAGPKEKWWKRYPSELVVAVATLVVTIVLAVVSRK